MSVASSHRYPPPWVVAAGWIIVAASYAHIALGSAGVMSDEARQGCWAAAALAVLLAIATAAGRGAGTRALSGVTGLASCLVAVVLVVAGSAHETGLVLLGAGVVISVLSIVAIPASGRRRSPPAS